MFGVRFSSSTSSSNYPLEITALTVVRPISGDHSKLQHIRRLRARGRIRRRACCHRDPQDPNQHDEEDTRSQEHPSAGLLDHFLDSFFHGYFSGVLDRCFQLSVGNGLLACSRNRLLNRLLQG
jgi:hypothetical protein